MVYLRTLFRFSAAIRAVDAGKAPHKLVIIGAGPAGLTAAIYAARAGLNPVVLAGGFKGGSLVPGGQLMTTTEVENYPGFPEGIDGQELMENFRKQAERFGANLINEFAESLYPDPARLLSTEDAAACATPSASQPHVVTAGGEEYRTDSVIIATGAYARWLGAPGEDELRNRGISACATCDGPLPMFRGQRLMVIGGGDSAVEEALFLRRFAGEVVVVHRRERLRASKVMASRLLAAVEESKGAKMGEKVVGADGSKLSPLRVRWNTVVAGYEKDEKGRLSGIKLAEVGGAGSAAPEGSGSSGAVESVECKGVFMAIGHQPSTEFLSVNSGVACDETGYVNTFNDVHTTVAGVFAAGDCHDRHFRQAITASGFGCMASLAAERYLSAM